MAFFDKLNQVAKNIGDKAGEAVETGKYNAKILSEKNAVSKDLEKIGEYYYGVFAAGGEVAPAVEEYFQSAKTHYEAIAAAQAEIERIKEAGAAPAPVAETAAPVAPAAPAGIACPACGKVNAPGTRFCAECGQKLEG